MKPKLAGNVESRSGPPALFNPIYPGWVKCLSLPSSVPRVLGLVRINFSGMTSEAVFLIDLASARPPHPPLARLWPALAREHCNQLKGCIHRIITHDEPKSVTTHVFDSTVLAMGECPATLDPEEALEYLDRRLEQVTKLDISGVKHPAARGIIAGISDAAPEDGFLDFYTKYAPTRVIYIFARVPSTKLALAAFLADEEFEMGELEQKLKSSPYLPETLRSIAKRGDRVVWVNSTPRRCELKDDVHHVAEQVFSKWLLSYSSKFQFRSLHSFLLDRRIVPAEAIVRSLSNDFSSAELSSGKEVEVLCLEDSHLLRCFQGRMNRFRAPVCEAQNSELSLVLSGIVRCYDTSELSTLGAFNTPACLLTPSSTTSVKDSNRPCAASIFPGLMVDLVRQSRCLIADLLEVNQDKESFVRYQTLLQPVTPVTAVLWRISRITSAVNYSAPSLPETFAEWVEWDAFRNIKDCETTDSVIQASPRFFETYLPTLFSPQGKEKEAGRKAAETKNVPKEPASSPEERMLMSFEGSISLPTDSEQQTLATLVEGIRVNPLDVDGKALGSDSAHRSLIIGKLRSQLKAQQKKTMQTCPKPLSPNKPLSRRESQRQGSPKSTHTFKWRSGSSKTIAPRPKDLKRCIEAHIHDEKQEQAPNYTCTNTRNGDRVEVRQPPNLARSELGFHCTRLLASQSSTEVTAAHHEPSPGITTPSSLRHTENDTSSQVSPKKVQASDATSREPDGHDLETVHRQASPCSRQKRKAEVLAPGGSGTGKRYQSANMHSASKENNHGTECEKCHRRDIRHIVTQFAVLMNKVREGNSRTLEEVLWECIEQLSALAAALSKNHRDSCDIDVIINLNLKIPKAVTAAVQEVQNKAKRDDISSKTLLVETWETIMYAFEQCVWHLASSRRTAINEERKTGFRRQVRQVSSILTCTQFMAEMAGNSRPQPVSFRSMFSKLFSSVFVHLGLLKPGKPFSEVLNLFETFEEPLPVSLRVKNRLNAGQKPEVREAQQENPKPPGILPRSLHGHKQRRSVQCDDTITRVGASENSASDSTAKGKKYAKASSVMKVFHSRKTTNGLGRAQFAKESEVLRNAVMSQARLPIKSLKQRLNQSTRATERKRSNHMDDLGSSLQTILANTVPAPVIDDPVHASERTLQDSHEQARSPSETTGIESGQLALQCVIADDTTVGTPDSERDATEVREVTPKETKDEKGSCQHNTNPMALNLADHADLEKSVGRSAMNLGGQCNLEPEKVLPDLTEKRGAKSRATLQSADEGPNPPQSLIPIEVSNLHTRAIGVSERCHGRDFHGRDPAHASSVEFATCEKGCRQQNEPREGVRQVLKRSVSACSTRYGTRSAAKQNMAKSIETKTSREPSDGAQCRVTRSQAKQVVQKRDAGPGGSSNRKRRRTKELSTDQKVNPVAQNLSESKPSSKPFSPITRSQAKAMVTNSSIQLRNRSVSCPTRSSVVKPKVKNVSADSGSPLKNCFTPGSPRPYASSSDRDILSPETPCSQTKKDALTPQTPRAYISGNEDRSAIQKIAESSLERRRKQLEHVDFIPETPVAPKPPTTKYTLRDSVKRRLWPKLHQ